MDRLVKMLGRSYVKNWENTTRPSVRKAYGNMAGTIGIIVNLLLSVVKLAIGYMMGSIAIISDGFHNLADVGAAGASIISFKLAGRAPDLEHPYGHGRIEYLFSIGVSMLIMMVGIQFFIESVKKIIDPEPIILSSEGVLVFALSIGGTLFLFSFYRAVARWIDSKVLFAASADSFSDLVSSGVILIGLLLNYVITYPLDGYLGIFASGMICHAGYSIFKESTSTLIGNEPSKEQVLAIDSFVRSYKGVLGVHDLMIHDYGPGHQFASIHVEVDADEDVIQSHEMIDRIEREAEKELGIQLTIHMDPLRRDEETLQTYEYVKDIVTRYNPEYSIHDLRMVHSYGHIGVLFDIVVPYGERKHHESIKNDISDLIHELNPLYKADITIDESYTGGIEIH